MCAKDRLCEVDVHCYHELIFHKWIIWKSVSIIWRFDIAIRGEWTYWLFRESDWIPCSFLKKRKSLSCFSHKNNKINVLLIIVKLWTDSLWWLANETIGKKMNRFHEVVLHSLHTCQRPMPTCKVEQLCFLGKYFTQLKETGWDFFVFTRKIAEGLPRNLWMCHSF